MEANQEQTYKWEEPFPILIKNVNILKKSIVYVIF
jgi:hypothetical protein